MELYSFWAINPADGQEGKPEPIKLVFFENGDVDVVSISEDPEYRGAYKLPSGSYNYTGDTLSVPRENLDRVVTLVSTTGDDAAFYSAVIAKGLINDQEWNLFFASPRAWKSLRILAVNFGEA